MINLPSRSALMGLGLLIAALAPQAHAQSTPKTVTLVVPFAAGGGTDTVARLIGERMSRTLGQTIIIENVVGGGSTLANDRVARSAPDGSTVLINHVALLAAPSLFTNLRYDTKTAFEPVGLVNNAPMVLIGRKSIPGDGTEGPCGLDQGAGRQGELRAWRSRDQQSFVRRDDGQCARLQTDGRGLSRISPRHRRSPGGADRSAVGSGDQRAAANSGRNASRHRHYVAATSRAVEGRADHRRARHARGQLLDVAWALRGEGHAQGDHQCAEFGASRGAVRARAPGEAEAARNPAIP